MGLQDLGIILNHEEHDAKAFCFLQALHALHALHGELMLRILTVLP